MLRFLENEMLRKIFGFKVRREQDTKEKVKWEALWFVVPPCFWGLSIQ